MLQLVLSNRFNELNIKYLNVEHKMQQFNNK